MKKQLYRFIIGMVIVWLVHAAVLIGLGCRTQTQTADAIIVLGNQVYPDGRLSPQLADRMDIAIPFLRQGLVTTLIVSGGLSEGYIDEAAAMARYAEERGVPAYRITIDSQGINTRATAKNAVSLLNERHQSTVIVCSSYFHIPRARWTVEQAGIQVVGQAPTGSHGWRDLYSVTREMIGSYAYFFGFRDG